MLHASDPASIHLAVGARLPGATPADVDAALFDRRSIYRTLAMRRTLFVATVETGPSVEGSSAPKVAATERRKLEQALADNDITDPGRWLESLADEVLEALAEAGDAGRSARELTAAVPHLATRIVVGRGSRQEQELATTSRVLGLMAIEGRLIRGRPAGGWTSRLYAWHRRDRWWPAGEGPDPRPDERTARSDLVERWLARFGPATVSDLVWWTGWTKTALRRALAEVHTVEVALEGACTDEPALLLADDTEPVEPPDPWAALLPALDPTAMGWKLRDWYVGGHRAHLFDRNGNIGPTVWLDGRIVGGWAQRPDGEVVVGLLDDIGTDEQVLVDGAVERMAAFLGDTVVKPSFSTPLQKRLSGA